MKNLVAEITKQIAQIKGTRFVSLTYLSKSANELARFTVNIGFSYHNLVEKSVTELELLIDESQSNWTQQRSVVTPIRRSTHVGVVGNTEVHMQFLDHLDP